MLATAHISTADLVPSRNELYIRSLGRVAVTSERLVGRTLAVLRQVHRALAGSDDLEAQAGRPVVQLLYERRLVTECQAVDHPCPVRHLLENGPHEHVGFDVDHHHVPAGHDRVESVTRSRIREPRGFDDDIDVGFDSYLR
jgi:hypothetical protein